MRRLSAASSRSIRRSTSATPGTGSRSRSARQASSRSSAIDHGARTWVTLRHVGLPSEAQVLLHEEMWRYWLARFTEACHALSGAAA